MKNNDLSKLKNMDLNEIDNSNSIYWIQKVPGGWIYIYLDNNGNPTTSIFVPEEIKVVENDLDFHNDWVIDYSDKYNNRKSKHVKFNNQKHMDNWINKWESFNNKIIGFNKANNLGKLIEENEC